MSKKNTTKKRLSPQVLVPMIVGTVCICIILVVVTVIMPQKATASELQEKLDLGTKYLTAGEYEKAEVAFNDALKIDEKSTDAAMGLAKTYNGMQQPDKALDVLKKAGKNIGSISNSSLKKNSDAWSQRISDYQNTFTDTKTLFKKQGETSKIEDVEKEERKIIDVIIKVVQVTPIDTTPIDTTPSPDDFSNGDDSGNNSGSRNASENPTPTEEPEQPVTPTPSEEPEQPVELTPTEEPEQPVTPTPSEEPEQPVTPTPEEEPEQSVEPTPTEVPEQSEELALTEESDPVPTDAPSPEDETDTSEDTGTDSMTDSMTDEEILSAYAAELEVSSAKYTGGTIAYIDSSSMSEVNGFLTTEQRDFDGDQIPELLTVSVSDGALQFELYKVDNGEVVQTSSETLDHGFGTPVEGITYSGSQECFIRDNGTSVDIGFASYYSGMSGDNGNPEVGTEIVLYKVGSNGEVSPAGDISLVNGTQVYLNENTPQDGGKETFISELSKMGLSGTWISESADILIGMDLKNNPMQDTAGVPNPINAGLSAKESGVYDLAIVNAGMQPGTSSMDFSVK